MPPEDNPADEDFERDMEPDDFEEYNRNEADDYRDGGLMRCWCLFCQIVLWAPWVPATCPRCKNRIAEWPERDDGTQG